MRYKMRAHICRLGRAILPISVRRWLRYRHWPLIGWVRWGNLRRLTPISRVFGLDRGLPIDRYYIELFLHTHRQAIQGSVLEIGEPVYTRQFGGERVRESHVLHATAGNAQATVVGDLASGEGIPSGAFDCMVLTQTFLVIYEVQKAITTCYAALKPGGVLLATFPGISQISRYDMERWGDYWRFTDASAQRLFGDVFGDEHVTVTTYGNVLATCAFLHGLAAPELSPQELAYHDPNYQLLITVWAVKQ